MGKVIFLSIFLLFCVQTVSAEVIGDVNDNNVIELSETVDLITAWKLEACISGFISADRFCVLNIPVRLSDTVIAVSIWERKFSIQPIGDTGIKIVFNESKDKGIARLYFTDMNKDDLFWNACWYADKIIRMAEMEGYQVKKTQTNMAWEIRTHVALYNSGIRDYVDHSLPIDIELYTGRWEGNFPDLEWEVIEIPCDLFILKTGISDVVLNSMGKLITTFSLLF